MGYFQTFFYGLSLIQLDLLRIVSVFLKMYRGLCLTYVFLEQFWLLNPYFWPVSVINCLTKPYFDLCNYFFPPDILRVYGFNFQQVVGWELLGYLIRVLDMFIDFYDQYLN